MSRKIFGPDSVTTRENITVRLASKKLKAYGYPAEYHVRHVPTDLADELVSAVRMIDETDASTSEKEKAIKRLLCDHILCDGAGVLAFADNYDVVYGLPMSVVNEMLQGWQQEFCVIGSPAKMMDELSEAVRESLGDLAKKNLVAETSSTCGE